VAIIINAKTKKQEKVVKDFLNHLDIEFQTIAEEEQAAYKTNPKKPLSPKEKKILNNLDQSVDFVNKYKKGKIKTPSKEQILHGIKQAVKEINLVKAGKLKARDARALINEL
jgi:hypothetical protein